MSDETPDEQATDNEPNERSEGAPGRSLGPDGGGLGYKGILARRLAKGRGRGAIETEPGTENEEPIVIEGEPVEDGETGEPAVVTDLDGNEVPAGDDGIPVLSAADELYDPTEHTVAEVQVYLSEHPDQTEHVLNRERSGKSRVTLIGA